MITVSEPARAIVRITGAGGYAYGELNSKLI